MGARLRTCRLSWNLGSINLCHCLDQQLCAYCTGHACTISWACTVATDGPFTIARAFTIPGACTIAGPFTIAGTCTIAGPFTIARAFTIPGACTIAAAGAGTTCFARPARPTWVEREYRRCWPSWAAWTARTTSLVKSMMRKQIELTLAIPVDWTNKRLIAISEAYPAHFLL